MGEVTRPAAGIRSGVETVFTEIKETTAAEIALMAKDKHHSPIVKKAMLPKKHSEMRFYGEIQVPESDLTAPVKGKQSRFFPVVIKLGATAPIKDDIIAIAVGKRQISCAYCLKSHATQESLRDEILRRDPSSRK